MTRIIQMNRPLPKRTERQLFLVIRRRIVQKRLLLVIKMIMKRMIMVMVLAKRRRLYEVYDPPVKEVVARQKWTGCWIAVDSLWRSKVAGMEPN